MIDEDLAVLAGDAYAALPGGAVVDFEDLRAVCYERRGGLVVAVRGTDPSNVQNDLRDIEGFPSKSLAFPQLGHCHRGFLRGAESLLGVLATRLYARRITLTGHSLGAAVSLLLAAMLTAQGTPPELLVTWESPRAGGETLKALLAPVEVRQYRYGNDPVTELPWLPGAYCHVREPLIQIGRPMFPSIQCHSMAGIINWELAHCLKPTPL